MGRIWSRGVGVRVLGIIVVWVRVVGMERVVHRMGMSVHWMWILLILSGIMCRGVWVRGSTVGRLGRRVLVLVLVLVVI
jgi:hypothetical protein